MEVMKEKKPISPPNRPENKKELGLLLGLTLLAVGLIGYSDTFSPVPYFYKSMGKVLLFVAVPLVYGRCVRTVSYKSLFRLDKSALKLGFFLGIGLIFLILGSYFATRAFVDLSMVSQELHSRLEIDGGNFVLVAVYIALCNSLLEEFFFRGFLFFRLRAMVKPLWAHITSSSIFAFYHVGIMLTWFDWWVFGLCMLALVIGGVIFNLLDVKSETLYPSWLCHSCANWGINFIGGILIYS